MEKVREGYNITKIGEIPCDWKVDKLGDKAYIKARIGWRGLSSDEYTDEGPYLVAGKHIKGSEILWDECDHISIERYNESSEIMLREKDIIMTKDGTIGRVGFIDKLNNKATINGTMMLIRPNEEVFYSKFLYYYFQGENFKKIINEKVSGSSIPHIFQRDMVNLEVPIPYKYEQEKIASILSTVDEQINNVDVIIEKNKELKKGLMQTLLTKGIGHTRFKKTEIGEIPEEWEIKTFKDISKVNQGLQIAIEERYKDLKEGRLPYITIQYINDKLNSDNEYFIENFSESVVCKEDDILMTRTGNTGIVVTNEIGVFHNNFFKVDFRRDLLNKDFLVWFLNTNFIQNLISRYAGTTTIPDLKHDDFYKLPVVIPSLYEQEKISSILSEVDEKLEEYKNKKQKLEELKKGLMQQLLTGKIRTI